ncbi:MAG: hypothetical protein AAFY37_15210, partial [Pseudomonadota bacterium]
MGGNTTSVAGNAISDLCVRYAGLLNIDVYENEKKSLPNELHPAFDINKKHWDVIWEDRRPDGFLARIYAPKEAAESAPTETCPPVLIFRGSDSDPEDFAELAGGLRIDWNITGETGLGSINYSGTVDRSASAAPNLNGLTMAEIRSRGLFEETLFVRSPGRTTQRVGGWDWSSTMLTLTWAVDASLFYGHNGDWSVNFAQGLGKEIPPQYENAIAAGRFAADLAMSDYGGRLIITGHSLGGGLASAAGIAARIKHANLTIKSTTYNAAGLHANTARLAGGTLATGAAVPTRAVHVKDEILNSMQAQSRLVPLLADLLNWGAKTMPPAIANPSPSPGVSPGPLAISGVEAAPKWQALPILFTLNNQTVGPPLGPLGHILGIASTSRTVHAFLDETVEYLFDRLSEGEFLEYGELTSLGTRVF